MRGSQLAEWRDVNELSQAELAHTLRVSRQTVITWEKSENIPPLVEIALRAIDHKLIDLEPHRQPNRAGRPRREVSGLIPSFFRLNRLPLERANINPAALLALMEEREKENVRLKRHADDLTLERDAAKAANSAKSSFLANMSHELLTTLNAIMGFSELIASEMFGPIGNPRYRDYANLIHDSGDQLLELINGVLDMSKIEAGEFELSEEQFDLEEVATQAVRFAKLAAARQSIILNLSIDLSAKLIFADKRAINKILAELISNGVKFAPQGGQVHICARRDAGGIEIAVADTGAGIDAEALKHLVASLEHEGGGRTLFQDRTGLGLALVKTLAALHGGTISIESVPSEGTVAKVRLPHAAVSDQGECTAPQHLEGTLRAFRGAA